MKLNFWDIYFYWYGDDPVPGFYKRGNQTLSVIEWAERLEPYKEESEKT